MPTIGSLSRRRPKSYDDDGNLLSDGRWDYEWNAENRLVGMETRAAATNGGTPRVKLLFTYDYMGRRVRKEVRSSWTNGAYAATNVTLFVYDGWNLVEEVADGSTNFYAWGLDLSGTLQGAGGIGGLVAADGIGSNTVLYAYDANGIIGQLVDVSDGSLAARYEFDPFGSPVVAAGDYAYDNPFRFSTKFQDDETGLLFYGYRYLSQGMGRWVSRDPIVEAGHSLIASTPSSESRKRERSALFSLFGDDPDSVRRQYDQPIAERLERTQGRHLLAFVRNALPATVDTHGLEFYECPSSTRYQRVLCRCAMFGLARWHFIAEYCTGCQRNCFAWCVQKWLDDNKSDLWKKACVGLCEGKTATCALQGCSLSEKRRE